MNMDFKCSENMKKYNAANGDGFADYLLLEFPPGFKLNHQQNTQSKLNGGGSDYKAVDVGEQSSTIVYYLDRNINANTSYKFYLRKFD